MTVPARICRNCVHGHDGFTGWQCRKNAPSGDRKWPSVMSDDSCGEYANRDNPTHLVALCVYEAPTLAPKRYLDPKTIVEVRPRHVSGDHSRLYSTIKLNTGEKLNTWESFSEVLALLGIKEPTP